MKEMPSYGFYNTFYILISSLERHPQGESIYVDFSVRYFIHFICVCERIHLVAARMTGNFYEIYRQIGRTRLIMGYARDTANVLRQIYFLSTKHGGSTDVT